MMRLTRLSWDRVIAMRALLPLIVSLVVFATTAAIGVIPGAPEAGKIIFEERCASCHGPKGLGDGPRAPFLSPQPASLITAGISVKSDKELLNVISNGKPRTAMPAWPSRWKNDAVDTPIIVPLDCHAGSAPTHREPRGLRYHRRNRRDSRCP